MPIESRPSGSSSRLPWRQLRLAVVSAVGYGALMSSVLPGTWPLMPFPQTHPVVLAGLLGIPIGLIVRRGWAPLLPLTLIVALNPPQTGIAGSLVAFLVVGPSGAAGIALGMAVGRRLQRMVLRRMLKPARARGAPRKRGSASLMNPQPD
jgi:hypothetical protein